MEAILTISNCLGSVPIGTVKKVVAYLNAQFQSPPTETTALPTRASNRKRASKRSKKSLSPEQQAKAYLSNTAVIAVQHAKDCVEDKKLKVMDSLQQLVDGTICSSEGDLLADTEPSPMTETLRAALRFKAFKSRESNEATRKMEQNWAAYRVGVEMEAYLEQFVRKYEEELEKKKSEGQDKDNDAERKERAESITMEAYRKCFGHVLKDNKLVTELKRQASNATAVVDKIGVFILAMPEILPPNKRL